MENISGLDSSSSSGWDSGRQANLGPSNERGGKGLSHKLSDSLAPMQTGSELERIVCFSYTALALDVTWAQ